MTAFITHCCANPRESGWSRFKRLCISLLLLLPLLLLPVITLAQGEERVISYAEIIQGDDAYLVNADLHLDLGERLTEALYRGVSLHFVLEFQLERARWYWLNEEIAVRSIHYRLSYHAITRSYRLSTGGMHQTFDSLDAALRAMQRVRNWHVVELDELQAGISYIAALRLRHDTSRLPRPFQVGAIGNRDWSVGTDWLRWTFLAGATP